MMKFVLVLCFLVAVHGHGMVMDPVNRASRWRVDSSAPANYDDNQLWCGGAGVKSMNDYYISSFNFEKIILFILSLILTGISEQWQKMWYVWRQLRKC